MKGKFTFIATIEKDPETGLFIGYIPSLPGAHTQAATLDELSRNLEEVASLCLEELTEIDLEKIQSEFVGTQQIMVNI
ncbi:MAG: type II toxin-antitoxin system HicB family antitoxin [Cytophagales bacterium]|nr:type II toxin-antitoxin system HicB family antitoxin [Cytophagales bacterium]